MQGLSHPHDHDPRRRVVPGSIARTVAPKASLNVSDHGDQPIQPAGVVGTITGPYNRGDHEWFELVVTYSVAVRREDIELLTIDRDHDHDHIDVDGEEE